jgi:hypothetical protein
MISVSENVLAESEWFLKFDVYAEFPWKPFSAETF